MAVVVEMPKLSSTHKFHARRTGRPQSSGHLSAKPIPAIPWKTVQPLETKDRTQAMIV